MSDTDPFALAGSTIDGKYRVLSVVGEGGFGVVYKGIHAGFDAPVAIKCLKLPPHFNLAAQDALVRQLREEGRTLLRLSQRTPGILQALDVGSFTTPSGARVPYLILEWLDGHTLAEEIRAHRVYSLREAFLLLDPAARALTVAHEEKVAHRDIKPENLFCISSGGKPTLKILDFGIAKLLGEATTPASGTAMGTMSMFTPSYGAPEQFDKTRGASGPWTDVFALALVFVELVTGKPALEGDGLYALFQAASNPASRPTPRARGVAAPEAVEGVLRKALEPDPRARFPDMGAFWGALESAMQGTADVSLPPAVLAAMPAPDPTSLGSADTVQFAPGLATAPATQVDVTTTARSAIPVERRRSPLAWVAAGVVAALVLGSLAAGGMAYSRRHRGAYAPIGPVAREPATSSVAFAAPVSAPPGSKNAEAAKLYRDAVQSWHDGLSEAAVKDLEQAVSLDRELGAAQLRLALWHFMIAGVAAGKQPEGREHYHDAYLHRGSLGESDAGLLAAADAYMRQPPNLHEWSQRLEELTKKFPRDAELFVYLGEAHQQRLQPDAAIAAYDHAIALDPTLIVARVAKAESFALKGDVEAQLREYHECLETSSQATQCLLRQLTLRGQLGKCGPMRADAQRLVSLDPTSAEAQHELALALHGTGSPTESVVETLTRSWALQPAPERKLAELQDKAALTAVTGDFVGSERALEEWSTAVAEKPNQSSHIPPAQRLAELYTEMELPARASEVADAFLRRMSSWSEQSTGNPTMLFLSYRLRAGSVTREEYDKARAEVIEKFRARWSGSGRKLDEDAAWVMWSMISISTGPLAAVSLRPSCEESAVKMSGTRSSSVRLTVAPNRCSRTRSYLPSSEVWSSTRRPRLLAI